MNNERSCLYENGPGSSRDALLEKLPLRTIEGEWQRSLDMIELSQRRLAHLIQDKQTPVSDKLETCLRDMQAASSRLDRTLNNTTALLLEQVPGGQELVFADCRFAGNGTDIDNRCDQPLNLTRAIFE